eukprot:g59754.t1
MRLSVKVGSCLCVRSTGLWDRLAYFSLAFLRFTMGFRFLPLLGLQTAMGRPMLLHLATSQTQPRHFSKALRGMVNWKCGACQKSFTSITHAYPFSSSSGPQEGTMGKEKEKEEKEKEEEKEKKEEKKRPQGMIDFIREYGALGFSVYTTMWIVGVPPIAVATYATDNFGLDIVEVLDMFQQEDLFGLGIRQGGVAKWQVSVALAVAINECLEPLRWLLVIPLTKRTRAFVDRGRKQQ